MLGTAYVWIFLAAMGIGVPIVFAMALAPIAAFLLADRAQFLAVVPQRIFQGINQFPLLAIPLFILAGEVMNVGGITERLVRFATALVGHFRGGLAQVNILSSILFAGLSGSAVADTSALGSMLIPAMEKNGYTRRFAAAVTAETAEGRRLGIDSTPTLRMVGPAGSELLAGLVDFATIAAAVERAARPAPSPTTPTDGAPPPTGTDGANPAPSGSGR